MVLYWEMISVAIAGAIGALTRFGLSRWIQGFPLLQSFPWGIFACNVLGCLLIGIFYGVLDFRQLLGPVWRAAIMIGFLGGFTTFSSFSLDTFHFLQAGELFLGLSNIFLNVLLCILATAVGVWLSLLMLG